MPGKPDTRDSARCRVAELRRSAALRPHGTTRRSPDSSSFGAVGQPLRDRPGLAGRRSFGGGGGVRNRSAAGAVRRAGGVGVRSTRDGALSFGARVASNSSPPSGVRDAWPAQEQGLGVPPGGGVLEPADCDPTGLPGAVPTPFPLRGRSATPRRARSRGRRRGRHPESESGGGRRRNPGGHPQRCAILLRKGRIPFPPCASGVEGLPGKPDTRDSASSSDGFEGVRRAAPRDYQAQSRLVSVTEGRGETLLGWPSRPRPVRRRGVEDERCRGAMKRRWRRPARERRDPHAKDRSPGAGGGPTGRPRQRAIRRCRGRFLFATAFGREGCLASPTQGNRLTAGWRNSGDPPRTTPRDYQAQSRLISLGAMGRPLRDGPVSRAAGHSAAGAVRRAGGVGVRHARRRAIVRRKGRFQFVTALGREGCLASPRVGTRRTAGRRSSGARRVRPHGTTRRSPNSLPWRE